MPKLMDSPAPATAPVPAAEDRLLLVHEVRALFPTTEDGKPIVSDRWIKEHVAPRQARRIGGRWAIRESIARAWMARFVAGELADEDAPTRVTTDAKRAQRAIGLVGGHRAAR